MSKVSDLFRDINIGYMLDRLAVRFNASSFKTELSSQLPGFYATAGKRVSKKIDYNEAVTTYTYKDERSDQEYRVTLNIKIEAIDD